MGRLSNRLKAAGSGSRLAVDLAPRHAFYDWCNEVLAEAEFDEAVEMLCQGYYKDGVGRRSIPPGRCWPPVDPSGPLLPHAVRRPVRRSGFRAGNRLAVR